MVSDGRLSNVACPDGMLLYVRDAKHMQYKAEHGFMPLHVELDYCHARKKKKKWKRQKVGSRTQQRLLGLWP